MSGQSLDYVFYKGRRYELVHNTSSILPTLDEIGASAEYVSTATWRGYEAEYEIDNDQLYLTQLNLGFGDRQSLAVEGVDTFEEPTGYRQEDEKYIWDYKLFYRLKHPMRINGTISITGGGVDDRPELAERTRELIERIKQLGDKASPIRWQKQPHEPLPPETLKLKLVEGRVISVKDITETFIDLRDAIYKIDQERMWRPLSQYFRSQERDELQKRYDELLSEELK